MNKEATPRKMKLSKNTVEHLKETAKQLEDSERERLAEREIGGIGNYYGGLNVKEEEGKCYWCIETYSGFYWEKIPRDLYDKLIEYDDLYIKEKGDKEYSTCGGGEGTASG